MEEFLKNNDLFARLHKGEQIKCLRCENGIIKPMSNRPIEKEFSFECDSCKAHYRYDPVVVNVE